MFYCRRLALPHRMEVFVKLRIEVIDQTLAWSRILDRRDLARTNLIPRPLYKFPRKMPWGRGYVRIQYCAKEMQTKFGVFRSLFSRNSTKFRHEVSSKRSRIFVESNEISLSSWRNVASTEAKFRFAEISQLRKFALVKFPQSEILVAVEEGCNEIL